MRKLSAFTILLLITNLLTCSCLIWGCHNSKKDRIDVIVPGCPGNCYSPSCVVSPPFNSRAAYEMVSNYRNNHWSYINNYCGRFATSAHLVTPSGGGNPTLQDASGSTLSGYDDDLIVNDARCAWFNLDTLKAFINTIETMSCSKNNSCPSLQLGIRIYYAEYPSDVKALRSDFGITNPDYAGMHTLLMIPTFNDGTNDVDFDPYTFTTNATCDHKSPFDTMQPVCALPPTASVTARNHGGLIPPPYKYAQDWNQTKTGAMFMRYVDSTNDILNHGSINRKQ